ncbi:MAG: hypothetical protein JWR55_2537 [Aeromicrobium sp.]|jgi:uncharacterized protein YciI|nr:hypothetical protein [Aeromicrobium sp.]
MALFATRYAYIDDSTEARDATRPAHREYLAELSAQGSLLLSGPYVGGEAGALLVYEAPTEADARALIAADPFVLEGLVAEVTVREWQLASGRLAPSV